VAELGRPRHGHFTIIHHDTGLGADVYVAGDDSLNAWAMERRSVLRSHTFELRYTHVGVRKVSHDFQPPAGGFDVFLQRRQI
jgi:hypothetical protein